MKDLLALQNRINWLLTVLLCTVAIGLPLHARAEAAKVEVLVPEGSFRMGTFAICHNKDEAIEVAEGYVKGGKEEADKLLEAKPSCDYVSLDFMVGDVVFVANAKDEFIKVVQVFNPRNTQMSVYWVTTVTIVKATKKHKPEVRKGQSA